MSDERKWQSLSNELALHGWAPPVVGEDEQTIRLQADVERIASLESQHQALQERAERAERERDELVKAAKVLYPPVTTSYADGGSGPRISVTLPVQTYDRLKDLLSPTQETDPK